MSSSVHIAPMQGYTNRHLRYLYRILLPTAVLWTEMLKPRELLSASTCSQTLLLTRGYEGSSTQPCVLQFGGDNADDLSDSIRMSRPFGYTQYDLNCGCPSTEVNAKFGASLMNRGDDVAYLVERMAEAANYEVPVSIKCRVGVHETYHDMTDDTIGPLLQFCSEVTRSGTVKTLVIHARSAVLQGLSPKKLREVPPLRRDLCVLIKQNFENVKVVYNGGVGTWTELEDLQKAFDGVMIGRWALDSPFSLLQENHNSASKRLEVVNGYTLYARREILTASSRAEYSSILMPLALLALSLEKEAAEDEGVDSGRNSLTACYETGWHLMENSVELFAIMQRGSSAFESQFLEDIFGAASRERSMQRQNDGGIAMPPPFKKFRKFLSDKNFIPKKVMTKMRGNCDEVYRKQ